MFLDRWAALIGLLGVPFLASIAYIGFSVRERGPLSFKLQVDDGIAKAPDLKTNSTSQLTGRWTSSWTSETRRRMSLVDSDQLSHSNGSAISLADVNLQQREAGGPPGSDARGTPGNDANDPPPANEESKSQMSNAKIVASMSIMSMSMVVGMMYLTGTGDQYVQLCTYKLLNEVFAIVCALCFVETQTRLQMKFLGMLGFTEVKTAQQIEGAITFLWFVCFLHCIPLASWKLQDSEVATEVWVVGMATNLAGGSLVDAINGGWQQVWAESVAAKYPGSAVAMSLYYTACVVAVWFILGICSFSSGFLRQKLAKLTPSEEQPESTRAPKWIETSQECEIAAGAFAAAYCYMHLIWSFVEPGLAQPDECALPRCTAREGSTAKTMLAIVLMCISVFGISRLSPNRNPSKWSHCAQEHLAFGIGWTCFLFAKFEMTQTAEDFRAVWQTPISQGYYIAVLGFVMYVLSVNVISIAIKRGWVDHDDMDDMAKGVRFTFAVLVEQLFANAVSNVVDSWSGTLWSAMLGYEPQVASVIIKVVVTIGYIASLIPAWYWYIAPPSIAGEKILGEADQKEEQAQEI